MTKLFLLFSCTLLLFHFSFTGKRDKPVNPSLSTTQKDEAKGQYHAPDTSLANAYFQKGMSLSKSQEFDSGAYYFLLSRDLYASRGVWEKYVNVSAFLVLNLIYLDKIDSASQINQRLLSIFQQKQLSDTVTFKKLLNYQGGIYSITKKLDSAILIAQHLLTLDKQYFKDKPDMLLGGTYHNLGTLYTDFEMLDRALQYYDSAETIYYHLNARESEEAARLYSNKAIVFKLLGNYEKSLAFNQRSYEIFKANLKPEHPRLALALFNIGNDLIDRNNSDQDNLEGIQYLNQGLNILKEGNHASHRYVTDYYRFMAKAYSNLNEDLLATAYLEKGLAKSIQINGKGHVEQAHIYEELGKIYINRQVYDSAWKYLEKSQQGYERGMSSDFKRIANICNLRGHLFAAQERYEEALKSYQKALSYFVPEIDTNNIFENPDRKALITHENFFSALRHKAETLSKASLRNPSINYLQAAFDTYLLLDAYVSTSRKHFTDKYVKLAFTENKGGFYENGIATGLLLYEKTNNEHVLENTLQLADHYKSMLLLEELEHNSAKMYANLPKSLIQKEEELKGAIYYTRQVLFESKKAGKNAANEQAVKALEAQLFGLTTDLELFIKTIEQEYPAYHQLKYHQETFEADRLRRQAGKGAAILQYFVGEEDIYAWLLDKAQLAYVKIPKPSGFEAEVQAFLNSLKNRKFSAYAPQGYALYQTLLAPVLAKASHPNIHRLLIIPDGVLGYLPFETLIGANPAQAKGYKDLAYLIRDYEVSYHYSASLLSLPTRPVPSPQNVFIGYAPAFRDNTEQLLLSYHETVRSYLDSARALPYAEEEVLNIAALLEGDVEIGAAATEQNFKNLAADYQIIHLASHSLIDDTDPLYSKLIFDPENDSIEDGLLHTYELYNMQLNAHLVCLSACNTGVGKYYKGEGIVSLARGFMYAGVPNVMMSLWSVADRPTKDIMQYFYEEMHRGTPYAAALHKAKLRYLEKADNLTADPYYWGPFIYLGQPIDHSEPSMAKSGRWIGAGLGLLLLATGIIMFFMRKKYFTLSP